MFPALLLALLACSSDDGTEDSGLPDSDIGSDTETQREPDYTCGWSRNDPGTLVSTGNSTGHVIANFRGYDQCEELVDIWDSYGDYAILFVAAAW